MDLPLVRVNSASDSASLPAPGSAIEAKSKRAEQQRECERNRRGKRQRVTISQAAHADLIVTIERAQMQLNDWIGETDHWQKQGNLEWMAHQATRLALERKSMAAADKESKLVKTLAKLKFHEDLRDWVSSQGRQLRSDCLPPWLVLQGKLV